MKIFTVSDFKDIFIFIDDKQYEKAIDALFESRTYLKTTLHQESAHVLYYLSYCQFCMNNPYGAMEWINMALKIDSYNFSYANFRTTVLSVIEDSIDLLIPYGIEKFNEVEKILIRSEQSSVSLRIYEI